MKALAQKLRNRLRRRPSRVAGGHSSIVAGLAGRGVQATPERDDTALFSGREMQRANLGIEVQIPVAAAVVLDHVFESGEAAIVHVGRGAGDLAEGGGLEIPGAGAGVLKTPVAPGDASVVKTLAGEVGSGVAGNAVGFSAEGLQAGLARQSGRVPNHASLRPAKKTAGVQRIADALEAAASSTYHAAS